MTDVLKHRFVSPKLDGTDTQQVQPSHWNDGHKFQGGNAGDILTRDPADATFGAKWASAATNVVNITATGTQHNYPCGPASTVTYIWCGNAADLTLTGLAFTTAPRPGDVVLIEARGAASVFLTHIDAASSVGNRFANQAGSAPTALGGGAGIGKGRATYVYEASGHWMLHDHEQGNPITIPFTAGNYSGQGTITAAMVKQHDYFLRGRLLTGTIVIEAFPASGASAVFNVTGWGYTQSSVDRKIPGIGTLNGAWGAILGSIAPSYVSFSRNDFANWPGGNYYLHWQGTWTVT